MHQWLNARCAKLLEELNNTPFTDDVDEIKLNLIRAAMREASVVMFQRAAENSRKAIEKLNKDDYADTIEQVKSSLIADVMTETETLLNEAGTSEEVEPESSPLNSSLIRPASESSSADDAPSAEAKPDEENKPKIQISSSVIRRAE